MGPQVIAWIQGVSYPAVLGLLIASGLGIPLSEDLILLAGGLAVAQAGASFLLMVLSAWLGILGGDLVLHRIGRRLGPRVERSSRFRKLLAPSRVARMERYFGRWGLATVFFARFVPGLRAPTFLLSGVSRLPTRRFLVADGSAALLSAPLVVWLGDRFGLSVLRRIERLGRWELGAVVALLAAVLVVRWARRRRAARRRTPEYA